MDSIKKPVQIAKDIYWVGVHNHSNGLHCNPYILVEKDEAVLFDPGSVIDFEYVLNNIKRIISIDKIKYVVLHHQDPDICSSVPLFEKEGAKFKVVTHWRTQTLVRYYGIKSQYYIVEENDYSLKLKSGREIRFMQTPYLHFPGAIVSYDEYTGTLLSSDLFGAFSDIWSLYAEDDYIEKMKTFHEHYMPSNEILRIVMEVFLGMDISIIAPQHGSIINKDISRYIKALRDLECGILMNPIKKTIKELGGYSGICNLVIKRYTSIYGTEEVREVLKGLYLELDYPILEITDYNYTGAELWQKLFEAIYVKKGLKWLVIIEPYVEKLSKEYELPMPRVFSSKLKKAEEKTSMLNEELIQLREVNARLKKSIRETQEKMSICPITGLYNDSFFFEYIKTELEPKNRRNQNMCLLIMNIDNMSKINLKYGEKEADEVLKGIAYILKDLIDENQLLFRLRGAYFACIISKSSVQNAQIIADNFRKEISNSEKFIEKVTLSIGIACSDELKTNKNQAQHLYEDIYNISMTRVRLAKMRMDLVCSESCIEDYKGEKGKILIVENDSVTQDVLKTSLENLQYHVITATDGEEALKLAEKEMPDLIISEIMLPKIDGFLLYEKLSFYSSTKSIPFIIVSHLKDEETVQRAFSLGIEHYIKKPYMLSEVIGIVKTKLNREDLK